MESEQSIQQMLTFLKEYQGRTLTYMEVCGSHTAAIAKSGIKSLISPKIKLVSGPGCPVCVTPSAYIDRLILLAKQKGTCVVTFGDLIRVPGSKQSLGQAKADGAQVKMVYAPADLIPMAQEHPRITYIFAAVGFETTTPVYTLLLEQIEALQLPNVKLLTALKTMPEVIGWLCEHHAGVDGFLAPGHVSVITGSDAFRPLATRYGLPFVVAGFTSEELIRAIYLLVKLSEKVDADPKPCQVVNAYPSAVTAKGNVMAQNLIHKYFDTCDAVWRGMGLIKNSGRVLKEEYQRYDAGSVSLSEDHKINEACKCGQILTGECAPKDCPLYKKVCSPSSPQGACMVSSEGSCYQSIINEQ